MPASKVNRRTLCMLFYRLLPRRDLECSDLEETIAVMLRAVNLKLEDLRAFCDLYYGDQRDLIRVSRAKIRSHIKDTRDVQKKEAFNHTFYGGVERVNTDKEVEKGYYMVVKSRGKKGDNRKHYKVKPSRRVPYFETLNPLHPVKEEIQRRAALQLAEDPPAPISLFAVPPPVKLTPRVVDSVASSLRNKRVRARPPRGRRRIRTGSQAMVVRPPHLRG